MLEKAPLEQGRSEAKVEVLRGTDAEPAHEFAKESASSEKSTALNRES